MKPEEDNLEDQKVVDSKFRLVILAAKRAKQLLKGSRKKIETQVENPLSIALEEIRQGKIDFEILMNEDLEKDASENLFMIGNEESTETAPSEDSPEAEPEMVESTEDTDSDSTNDSEDETKDD
jgi:DNA-directed RNA polymerase subunit omega